MIKLVILDMDGTMFDTEPLWDKAFMETNKILGYNVSEELHQKIIGSNGKTTEMILKNSLGEDYPFQRFNELYFDTLINLVNKEGIKIKPGLIELLNYLINNKYPIALASSSRKDIIYNDLEKAGIDKNIFNIIVSGDDLKDSKPNPEIFIKTCQKLNVKPSDSIVIEDSNNGIIAASKAGCIPILIPDIDIITDKVLSLVKYKCDNLSEVIDILKKY